MYQGCFLADKDNQLTRNSRRRFLSFSKHASRISRTFKYEERSTFIYNVSNVKYTFDVFKIFPKYFFFNLLAEFMFAGKSVWITILSETFDIFTLGQTSQQNFYQTPGMGTFLELCSSGISSSQSESCWINSCLAMTASLSPLKCEIHFRQVLTQKFLSLKQKVCQFVEMLLNFNTFLAEESLTFCLMSIS